MMLAERIVRIKQCVVDAAGIAEDMVSKGVEGLLSGDRSLLLEVIEELEPKMDRAEVEVESECVKTIALFQPKAVDLRTVIASLRIVKDLERMGDLAFNIAQSGLLLIDGSFRLPVEGVGSMGELVLRMLRDAISSFVEGDAGLALCVCRADDHVDAMRDALLKEFILLATRGPINGVMELIRVVRCLERVGDLSTNVAEEVVFMVEGRVIKHGGL